MSSIQQSRRLLHVDALKALAAQLIVLHHLSAYGPIADAVQALAPQLIVGLYRHGRMAVQVFLVVGGFLSARGLWTSSQERGQVLRGSVPELLWRRYLRLAPAFMVAVLLTLACSALIEPWLPELVPESVSALQLLSHGLLLHGVLGQPSLTVGAWYVAVDFQLFALLVGLLWMARLLPRGLPRRVGALLMVLAMSLASLFVFNLMPELEDWAPYFFGSYSLGVVAHGLSQSRSPRVRGLGVALLVTTVALALALEYRERIVIALVTALLLFWLQRRHQSGRVLVSRPWAARLLAQLGTRSYSLFLVHFPVCLLVNGLFERQELSAPWAGVAMMALAWTLSNLASLPFYRWIEAPAGRLRLGALLPRLLRA